MTSILLFALLQLMDFATTMVAIHFGAAEGNPFVRNLMNAGPAAGVAAAKMVALAVGGLCLWRKKQHILRRANYGYAAVVAWNVCTIALVVVGRG
jgi:hypothetical protein